MTVTESTSAIARARSVWRRLRTMRTALILLLLLGAGASVGSFFPQRPINPQQVDEWIQRNPGWAPLAEDLGLFDVYGSWWFMALSALLLASLVGCIVPRYRALGRSLRSRPRATFSYDERDRYHLGTTPATPEVVLATIERVLRRRRFRVHRHDREIAADRGNAREAGSLIFHTAFLVLLIGMAIGKLFGHTGQVAVVEGESFRDTRIAYDVVEEGRFFGGHTGAELVLDDFEVTWHPNGVPDQFVSSVRVIDPSGATRPAKIYVNSPYTYGSVRFYQLSWGWAPVIKVTQGGRTLYEGPTVFLSEGELWRGVVKVPGTTPQQMGLELLFITAPELTEDGTPVNVSPEPRDPLLVFQQFLGDLGLDRAQSVYELDPRGLAPAEDGALRLGESVDLPGGIAVSFEGLKQYSVFEVASNPGALVLLLAAVAILGALIPALYSSRRRIWVRVTEHDERTRLEIAGQALQRRAAFAIEFDAIVRDLDRNLAASIGVHHG